MRPGIADNRSLLADLNLRAADFHVTGSDRIFARTYFLPLLLPAPGARGPIPVAERWRQNQGRNPQILQWASAERTDRAALPALNGARRGGVAVCRRKGFGTGAVAAGRSVVNQ